MSKLQSVSSLFSGKKYSCCLVKNDKCYWTPSDEIKTKTKKHRGSCFLKAQAKNYHDAERKTHTHLWNKEITTITTYIYMHKAVQMVYISMVYMLYQK